MGNHLITAAIKEEVSRFIQKKQWDNLNTPYLNVSNNVNTNGESGVDNTSIKLLITGIGIENAKYKVQKAIQELSPLSITSIGFSGLTQDKTKPGTLLIADKISLLKGAPTQWDLSNLIPVISPSTELHLIASKVAESQKMDFRSGNLLTLPIIARTTNLKLWLGRKFEIEQIDMESYPIAQLADEANIPFVSVRVGIDSANFEIPELITNLATETQKSRLKTLAAVAKYLLKSPGEIKNLLSISIKYYKASKILARFCNKYIDVLSKEQSIVEWNTKKP